ncbi:MAG: RES family NAD+ phosphorylase, partial [Pseudomonadota bacterium]
MSPPIWTRDALSSNHRHYRGSCWRLVEAQHRVATLKLVDGLDEQSVLEDILEETKPNVPPECRHLHYLFATPFRYGAPYPHGSRFRRAGLTPGVYYAAEHVEAAVAEIAFYRLLFFVDSPDTPYPDGTADFSAIAAELATERALDLTMHPFSSHASDWTCKTDYSACQALADGAREAGTEVIRTQSVRDRAGRANVAVLTCLAFARPEPIDRQTWRLRIGDLGAQAVCEFPEQS